MDKQTDTQHINYSQVSFWQGRLRNNRLHVWCNGTVYAQGTGRAGSIPGRVIPNT